ncbi:Hypothetical_protein [Hexamita inflata]|uniref:Hypothetical_protein n=1 Tax=Hexamita inflata TaxID=28002 RepID=A0AA86QKN2_9EUKA|nr:Hypothetical protein HINF_LOCUS48906 [Hexamita inflata]
MSIEIEIQGKKLNIILTLQHALRTGDLYTLQQLKEIQKKTMKKVLEEAEYDYETLLTLQNIRDKYNQIPKTSTKGFTLEQFLQPYERCFVEPLNENSSQQDLIKYFHTKILQVSLLAVRSRQERMLIARNIIADLELNDAI